MGVSLEWNVGGEQISFRLSLCQGQKYQVNGCKFSPLVYQSEWVLPFAKTLGKWLWQSWDPAPVYKNPSPCQHSSGESVLIPPINPSSQELNFHLRILNINSALKKTTTKIPNWGFQMTALNRVAIFLFFQLYYKQYIIGISTNTIKLTGISWVFWKLLRRHSHLILC